MALEEGVVKDSDRRTRERRPQVGGRGGRACAPARARGVERARRGRGARERGDCGRG